MKFLTFEHGGKISFGVVTDDGAGVVDLGARMPDTPGFLELLRAGGLDKAKDMAAGQSGDVALADIEYRRPVLYPEKIICVGINYANRSEEYSDKPKLKYPNIFMRTPDSLVGHGEPIQRPPESEKFDYEGEIAIVIGKAGRRIPEDRMEEHVAGLTCLQEGTLRDWLRHGTVNVTQGKNFEKSGSVGPWVVSADEFTDYDDLRVTTRVNGEVRQDDTTANLTFPFRYLVHYISTWTELKPGDIISTGTPTGAGVAMDPPVFLKPGDVVEVEATGVGTLSNPVIDEPS